MRVTAGLFLMISLGSPAFAQAEYRPAMDLLSEGYEVVPVGQPFIFGLKKEASLFLCELGEFQSSESLLVRRSILEALELRKEPLVKPVAIPVTCFSLG